MTPDKLLSLLGLCRRAGRLQWGHDACLDSVRQGRARLCLLASDGSARLKREFLRAASCAERAPDMIETAYTMQQFFAATGCRAGVLSTEDEGFAKRLAELHREHSKEDLAYDQ